MKHGPRPCANLLLLGIVTSIGYRSFADGFALIRYRLLLLGMLVSLLAALPARANGRFPKADLVVFDPADPKRMVVRATFGLLESTDGGRSFDWICEEAIGLEDEEDPMIALTANGSLVAATMGGLRVGTRAECGIRSLPELDGEIVPDLTLDRSDPRRILAFRTRALPISGFDSQLYLSEDDGELFKPLGPPLGPELLPLSIDIAPSAPRRVYLTARLPREQDYRSVLLRSEDGGETFERFELEGTEELALGFIAGVHPLDADWLYVRVALADTTPLMLSRDGGQSFETIHTANGGLLGFALSPDGERIAYGGPSDGVWVANADGSDAEQRSELAVSCLGWTEEALYACSASTEDFGFGRSEDEGASFEPLLAFSELCGNTSCDRDSEIGSLCSRAWNTLSTRLGATCNVTAPSGGRSNQGGASNSPAGAGAGAGALPPEPRKASSGGCGFSAAPVDYRLALALGAGAVLRRRRRRICSLLAFGALACSEPAELEPYRGEPAYPNQRPRLEPDGRRLGYVSNSLSDTISVVDLDSFELLAEAPVGRNPVDTDGPHHLALDREAGFLYVALSYPAPSAPGPHAGHGFSEQFGYAERLALDDLRSLGAVRVDSSPGDLALSPDRERLVVSHYDLVRAAREPELEGRRASLVWVTPARLLGSGEERLSRLSVCIAPHAIAFSSDERRVFVACAGEDSIAVVDLEEETVVAHVPVAPSIGRPGVPAHAPYAFASDTARARVLVSNLESESVALFSTAGELPERKWVTPLLGTPMFAAWLEDERLVVPLQAPSAAALLDAETGELTREARYTREDCLNPHEAVVSSDGRLFLVCEGDRTNRGTLVELDQESLELRARLEVGVYPDRLLLLEP